MTQTTGQISAKDMKLTLNAKDISGSSNYIEITPKRKTGKTATFDGDWELTATGKMSWEGNIKVVYTETTDEGADVSWNAFIAGAPIALAASPKGGSTGDWEFSGNIIITEAPVKFDGTSEDPVMVEFPFTGTGALTKAAIATT